SEALLHRQRLLGRAAGRADDGSLTCAGEVELREEVVLVEEIRDFERGLEVLLRIGPGQVEVGYRVALVLPVNGRRRARRGREIGAHRGTGVADIEARGEKSRGIEGGLVRDEGVIGHRGGGSESSRDEQDDGKM